MKDYFWKVFVELKNDERYYWYYQIRSKRIDNFISGFLSIVSLGGVASWFIWERYAWLWATIIGISQVISALSFIMPFSSRASACEYLLPEMQNLLEKVEHYWNFIQTNGASENEINDKALEFKEIRNKIESKYTSGTYWPISNYCYKKAQEDIQVYFTNTFLQDIKEKENGE